MITRRDMVMTLTSLSALPLFAADPWSKKSDEWSDKDIQRILTRSPWAKSASVEIDFQSMRDGGGGPGGMGGPPGGGMGGPGGGMGGPPGGGGPGGGMGGPPGGGMGGPGGGMPELHALVRWESALPIRAALKEQGVDRSVVYKISLSGLPLMSQQGSSPQGEGPGRNLGEMQERIKQATRLERKGKDPVPAVSVDPKDSEKGSGFLFRFDPGQQTIQPEDKEVVFVSSLGPLQIKARFALKEMVYQGKLEL